MELAIQGLGDSRFAGATQPVEPNHLSPLTQSGFFLLSGDEFIVGWVEVGHVGWSKILKV